jgi:transposase
MTRKQTKYTTEFKSTIVELYNSGKGLSELSSEYGIPVSTISGWVKNARPVVLDEGEVVTLKEYKALKQEMARIKEENEILKKPWPYSRRNRLSN